MTKEDIINKVILRKRYVTPQKKRDYNKEYQRRLRRDTVDVFTLTEEEKIRMGLIKKPAPLKGTIHIVVPEHYGASGLIWQSHFVTEAVLPAWKREYPNLEVIDDAKHS